MPIGNILLYQGQTNSEYSGIAGEALLAASHRQDTCNRWLPKYKLNLQY